MSERKPKERKPMIQPGSVLGEGPDILSSVLSSYAQSTGQPAPVVRQDEPKSEPAAEPTREETESTPAPVTEQKPAAKETSKSSASELTRQPADKSARQPKATKPKKGSEAEEDARRRAESPRRLCSYRVPAELDDWMEEYAFRHRHTGLKKQDLITEAIQLLIVAKSEEDQE